MKSTLTILLIIISTCVYGQYWDITLISSARLKKCKFHYLENDTLYGVSNSISDFKIHIGDINKLKYKSKGSDLCFLGGCCIGGGLGLIGTLATTEINLSGHRKDRLKRADIKSNMWMVLGMGVPILVSLVFTKDYDLSKLDLEGKRKLIDAILSKK
jgi:hypothetical protein